MSRITIALSSYAEQLAVELSRISGRSKTASVEDLLYRLETISRHSKLPADVGADLIEAAAIVNARGGGAKHLDPELLDDVEEIDFDITLLEKSSKSSGGFAGVNVSGDKFRAAVPDADKGGVGTKHLGRHSTPLKAAIERYRYFEKHHLPYGNMGAQIEHYRKTKNLNTDQALAELRMFLSGGPVEGMKHPVTLEEVEALIRRRGGLPDEEFPPEPPKPVVHVCAKCEQPIGEEDRIEPFRGGRWVHMRCVTRE